MAIKVLSSINDAYLSQLGSLRGTSGEDAAVSFSDALASAQELLDAAELSDAEKNAVRAMTVDAAVDAIRQNGGYGLALDSSLAKSLGVSAVSTAGDGQASSLVPTETAEEAAARIAASKDTTEASDSASDTEDTTNTSSTETSETSQTTYASDIETYSVDAGELACSSTLDEYFEEASSTYDVDLKLLKCIGLVESDFNADCTSSAGAMGVMQLMPETAEELGVDDPYDAYQNIMGGAKYISQLLDKYDGDIALAAAAYNAGPGAVAKYDGIPPYDETQRYVAKVLSYYNS